MVTKEELFRAVWPETAVSDAALTTCIQELRRALVDDARQPRYIETVHRRGFRFLIATSPRGDDGESLAAVARSPRTPQSIVGRETPLGLLSDALARTCKGERQVLFVSGAAGIGKTTLVNAWLETIAADREIRVMRAECTEHHGAGEALQPLLDALGRFCRQPRGQSYVAALRQCAPTWLAQLPAFQAKDEWVRLRRRTAGVTTERMLRELTDVLEQLSAREPIVLCLDDLHWSDPLTLDWIAAFGRRTAPTHVLVIGTYRPGEVVGRKSPTSLVDDLGIKGLCVEIALTPLDPQSVTDYVLARFPPAPGAGTALEELAGFVHTRTEGNPLFVVNVLSDVVARSILTERDGGWTAERLEPTALAIPADIRRAIEQQVERLDRVEQCVLEIASATLGTCSVAAIAAGGGMSEREVESICVRLARRQVFLRPRPTAEWPDGTWTATFEFLHSLYREALATRLSPGRRVDVHRAIGERLEKAWGDRASELATELSWHFEEARDFHRAVRYLQQAAETARCRSAHAVAERHYRRAIELLERLPASDERDEREVALQIGFGQVVMQTHGWGYPAVEAAYTRVRHLSEARGPGQPLLSALWHLWIYTATRGDLDGARAFADRLSAVARQLNEPESLLQAHHAQWSTLFSLGDLRGTEVHAGKGIETYDRAGGGAPSFGGHDAGICARMFRGRVLALCGHTDGAATLCDETLRLARELDQPFTMAFALMHAAGVHQTRRDARLARMHAREARDLAREHRFDLMAAWASCYLGWAMVESGDLGEGVALLDEGVAAAAATGSILFQPHMLALRATAELVSGRSSDARITIREAMAITLQTGESFHLAELHRLNAEIHLAQGRDADSTRRADEEFRTAMHVATEQGAAQLRLRAAIGLVRLRRRAGGDDAMPLLAEARRRVVEGGDLPDAREADVLLSSG